MGGFRMESRQNFIVSLAEMKAMVGTEGGWRVLDCRSKEEYDGEVTGYSYVAKKGRIMGAEHLDIVPFQLSEENSTKALARTLKGEIGISETDKVVVYCGTGWRASRFLLMALDAGFKNFCVYEGGWYEWSSLMEEE